MYNIVKGAHNILGMVVMLALLVVFIIILARYAGKKPFDKVSKTASLAGLITVHLQLAFGWLLYFLSPYGVSNFSGEAMKATTSRFYLIEHPVGMILAAALITMGFKRAKKAKYSDKKKHQQVLIFYGIGLTILSYFIPWFVWS